MKKFFVFTAAAAMLLSLAACAQNAEPAVQPEPAQQEETMPGSQQIPNPWIARPKKRPRSLRALTSPRPTKLPPSAKRRTMS